MLFDLTDIGRSLLHILSKGVQAKEGETVVIVTDHSKAFIARELAFLCNCLGLETITCIMKPTKRHGMEPPIMVKAAMTNADIVFLMTEHSITHTDAEKQALQSGARVAVIRDASLDTLSQGAILADLDEMHQIALSIADVMRTGNTVRIRTALGTDVSFSIAGREPIVLSGVMPNPGTIGGYPAGETAISPVEGTAEGIIYVDHAIDEIGKVDTPVKLTVEHGLVVKVEGGTAASALTQLMQESGPEARNLAEFALGTNPLARMKGIVGEDKKALGTIHVAVGDNHVLGGEVSCPLHLDAIVLRPSVFIDNKLLLDEGKLLI